MESKDRNTAQPNRRTAIKTIGVACAAVTFPSQTLGHDYRGQTPIKLGVIADLHGGFATDADVRLDAFLKAIANTDCHALVQMGDFAYPNKANQIYADKFNSAHESTIHVIGNHDLDHKLTREDCHKAWGIDSSYYTRDVADALQMIVLDGNERGSPSYKSGYPSFVGKEQLAWLKKELEATDKPVVILSHQPLAGAWPVDNAVEIQKLLSAFASKIVLCINGHSHVDSHLQIGGVNYLHVNSASYFWVGGEARTAYYTDSLFSTISIDLDKSTVSVEGTKSTWKDKSPKELGYFDREDAPDAKTVTPQIRSRRIKGKNFSRS